MINPLHKTWQKTPDTLSLSRDHIDVWLCNLKHLSSETDKFYVLLSDDERERADKLKIEDKQQQFIIARGYLRQCLGLLTKTNPTEFVFDYLDHGKPVLKNNKKYNDITFNVSHSYDLALIAISLKRIIGIDIEKINQQSDPLPLVTRFFSKAEQAEFNALSETIRAKAFCACWTRKEAFIKAIGNGITYGLDSFDVTIDPEIQTPEINLLKPSVETWSAINLPINDEYMACLVNNSSNINVRYWC
jgi:4'-phosphopantetheinyl transferase